MILAPKHRGWTVISEKMPAEWLHDPESDSVASFNDKRWATLRKLVEKGRRIK